MDSRLIKPLPKPLLLKDYLVDDLSSCSSNGFKSFPRKQCCSTVGFLHEFDRKNKQQRKHMMYLNSTKPSTKSALSALQCVITSMKRLPFGASKSLEKKKSINIFMPRSFSKKILMKSSFWKRKSDQKEIVRLKPLDQLLKEDSKPSDRSDSSIKTTVSKSKSWMESDVTVSAAGCASGNSSTKVNLNLPEESNDAVKMKVGVVSDSGVGVPNDDVWRGATTCSDGSADANSKKRWSSEEKEQFSPVSVLDCPFGDEDDEVSSPFQHRVTRIEGTKNKLLMKIQRFERLAKLEPVSLATRFALQSDSDNESSDSPLPHSSSSVDEKFISGVEEDEQEHKALELLHRMKISMPSYALKLNANKLLLDFFRERTATEFANSGKRLGGSSFHEAVVQEAEDWINGRQACDSFMEWEKQKNREGYVEEMEKKGEWKTLVQENAEVPLELENEVFGDMLDELVLDMMI